jgi:hypothetical protein
VEYGFRRRIARSETIRAEDKAAASRMPRNGCIRMRYFRGNPNRPAAHQVNGLRPGNCFLIAIETIPGKWESFYFHYVYLVAQLGVSTDPYGIVAALGIVRLNRFAQRRSASRIVRQTFSLRKR